MFSNMCNKLDIIDIYAPTWEGVLDYTICIYSHVTYGLFVWCWDTYTLTYNKSNLLFHNNHNKNTPFHLTRAQTVSKKFQTITEKFLPSRWEKGVKWTFHRNETIIKYQVALRKNLDPIEIKRMTTTFYKHIQVYMHNQSRNQTQSIMHHDNKWGSIMLATVFYYISKPSNYLSWGMPDSKIVEEMGCCLPSELGNSFNYRSIFF